MSVALTTQNDTLDVPNKRWNMILALAEEMGWEPAGILPPEDVDGPVVDMFDYCTQDGRGLSAEDCKYLSQALNRGVDYISFKAPSIEHSDNPFLYFASHSGEVDEIANLFGAATSGVRLW